MSTTERAESESPVIDLPPGVNGSGTPRSKPYGSAATQHRAADAIEAAAQAIYDEQIDAAATLRETGIWPDELDPPPSKKRRSRQLIPAHLAHTTAVFQRDAYRCVLCGSWRDLAVKHIVARRAGGSDEMTNLQTVCRTCSNRKGGGGVKAL